MPVSKKLREQAASGKPWEVLDVLFEKKGDVGIITIRRPKALNALNTKVFKELEAYCDVIKNDPQIKAAVITGFGNKAFVLGQTLRKWLVLLRRIKVSFSPGKARSPLQDSKNSANRWWQR